MTLPPEQPAPTETFTTVIYCSGHNRFGRACLNTVRTSGDLCGVCHGPTTDPFAVPRAPQPSTPELPEVDLSGWTSAEVVAQRLAPLAASNEHLQRLIEVGFKLAANSKAQSTQIAYSKHWETFEVFRQGFGLGDTFPAPAEHVAFFIAYLTERGNLRTPGDPLSHGYIVQAVSAIRQRHTTKNHASPTEDPMVEELLEGYAKIYGTGHTGKPPLRARDLSAITTQLAAGSTFAARDRALCILATAGLGLSLGHIIALDGEHVVCDGPTVTLLITKRKGGQLHPVELPINTKPDACPTNAFQALQHQPWGPVFRNKQDQRLSRAGALHIINTALAPVIGDRPKGRLPILGSEQLAEITRRSTIEPLQLLRTRAVLLNGYWAAMRGSELAALRWADAKHVDKGLEWRIRRAKNDQKGEGHTTAIPRIDDPFLCPVQATIDYHTALTTLYGTSPSPKHHVFHPINRTPDPTKRLSVEALSAIVNKAATQTGLTNGPYTTHSLRAGFVTDAIDAGAKQEQVAHHGRWTNPASLGPYYRRADLWTNANPAAQIAETIFRA